MHIRIHTRDHLPTLLRDKVIDTDHHRGGWSHHVLHVKSVYTTGDRLTAVLPGNAEVSVPATLIAAWPDDADEPSSTKTVLEASP